MRRVGIMGGAVKRPLILLECWGSGRPTTRVGAEMHGSQTLSAEIEAIHSFSVAPRAGLGPLAEGIVMTSAFGSVGNWRRHDRQQNAEAYQKCILLTLSQRTACAHSTEHDCIPKETAHVEKRKRQWFIGGTLRKQIGARTDRKLTRATWKICTNKSEPKDCAHA